MKITKEEIQAKIAKAEQANKGSIFDAFKSLIPSKPMKLTGYERPENPFRECQTKRPKW